MLRISHQATVKSHKLNSIRIYQEFLTLLFFKRVSFKFISVKLKKKTAWFCSLYYSFLSPFPFPGEYDLIHYTHVWKCHDETPHYVQFNILQYKKALALEIEE
jgi:hypothetical protein